MISAGGAAQGNPQRWAELSLEIVQVVHAINLFNVVNARRRSERTVLAGRPNSDAMSASARSS